MNTTLNVNPMMTFSARQRRRTQAQQQQPNNPPPQTTPRGWVGRFLDGVSQTYQDLDTFYGRFREQRQQRREAYERQHGRPSLGQAALVKALKWGTIFVLGFATSCTTVGGCNSKATKDSSPPTATSAPAGH